MNRVILQASIISFLIIPLVAGGQSKVVENKSGKYQILAPVTWKLKVDGTTTDLMVPDDNEFDVWQEFIGVSLSESNGLSLNETFTYYLKEDFPSYYQNFAIIKKGEEIISGEKFLWVLYCFSNSAKADAATLYNLFYLSQKNDTLYSINAISEKSGYPKLEPAFLTIIRSFQITP